MAPAEVPISRRARCPERNNTSRAPIKAIPLAPPASNTTSNVSMDFGPFTEGDCGTVRQRKKVGSPSQSSHLCRKGPWMSRKIGKEMGRWAQLIGCASQDAQVRTRYCQLSPLHGHANLLQ